MDQLSDAEKACEARQYGVGRRVHYEVDRREIIELRKLWQGTETAFEAPREATGKF